MQQSKNDKGIQIRRWIKMNVFGMKSAWEHYRRFVRNANLNYYASQQQLLNIIVLNYHVIEKCLAMPNFELGHGQERVAIVCGDVLKYRNLGFDTTHIQYISALQAIDEYNRVHKAMQYNLSENLQKAIDEALKGMIFSQHNQPYVSREEFFCKVNAPFDEFALSRHSCRSFADKDVPISEIMECVDLARTTPTACNRQPNKTYIVASTQIIAEIIKMQKGGRGFAERANKLLIVTARTMVFNHNETFETFKSGGMYVMNLLYALHFHRIGTCPLEWCDANDDKKLRKLIQIPDDEEVIMLVVIGYPQNSFHYVTSHRNALKESLQIR